MKKTFYTFSSLCALVLSTTATGQIGSLDLSFSTDGKVVTDISGDWNGASALAIQSDNKIVAVGYAWNGIDADLAVIRYNPSGSLDNTFGTGGIVTTPIGLTDEYGLAVALQSDGKILVAGSVMNGLEEDFLIVRYNSDGTLDNTFGVAGVAMTAIGSGEDVAYSIVVQTDGKIILAGKADNGTNFDFAAARYNSDGSLDITFDTDGILMTDVSTDEDFCQSVALQTDGKLVLTGGSFDGTFYDFSVVRYNANGSLDLSFDTDGMVTTTVGNDESYGYTVKIQSNGKIVVAGIADNATDGDFALCRYNTNGALDVTFDTDGMVMTDFGAEDDYSYALSIQADGKIVVSGYTYNGTNADFGLARYNSNGTLDITFDSDGLVSTDFFGNDEGAYGIAIQTNGRIVLAGTTDDGDEDFALARYLICDHSDSSFNASGCGAYTVPSGDETYLVNGIYMDTIPNMAGCDSVLTINVTILNANTSSYSALGCGSYTVPSGDETYLIDGIYMDTIPNIAGCDSVMTITVNIELESGSSMAQTSCNPITINSITYNSSGIYTQVLVNSDGCDSTITLDLDINSFNLTITQNGSTLSSNLTGVWFQWLDCNNNDTIIPGAYYMQFTPSVDGDYSVIMTNLSCTDTTACFSIDNLGLDGNLFGNFEVYPNPTSGDLTITTNQIMTNATLKLVSLTGQVLQQENNLTGSTFNMNVSEQAAGVYFVEIHENGIVQRVKLVKN